MSISRFIVPVLALALIVPLRAAEEKNKVPEAVEAILDKADAIELYSLDPARPKDKPKDEFHGWRVLGHTTVKDDDARKALVAALVKGAEDNKGVAANCFNPRHAIRATHDGKTVDLVICFECMQVQGYTDKSDKSNVYFLVTKGPQGEFDKLLKAAKVPLPEK
jgi:hypothetical protein